MKTTEKQKICWNCEGNVSRKANNCPYCGVYLHPLQDDPIEEDEGDDLTPPYKLYENDQETEESIIPPYVPEQKEEQDYPLPSQKEIDPAKQDLKNVMTTVICLMTGSMLALFGLLLLLFSRNGVFTLQWDGTYWMYYLLISLPLLYLGWKTLQKMDPTSEENLETVKETKTD